MSEHNRRYYILRKYDESVSKRQDCNVKRCKKEGFGNEDFLSIASCDIF